MVYVVVSVRVKEDKLKDYIDLLKGAATTVRKEKGCIQYAPTVDLETGGVLPQTMDKNTVMLLEKWESMEALKAHLATPHMAEYFKKEKPLLAGPPVIKVLQEA